MKKPIVVLTGPTAVGNTDLSIQLAKVIGGEIISADSKQEYKYMDVGSAKITPEEMDGVRHYLVDELEPFDEFHVVKFQEYAQKYLNEIYFLEQRIIIYRIWNDIGHLKKYHNVELTKGIVENSKKLI